MAFRTGIATSNWYCRKVWCHVTALFTNSNQGSPNWHHNPRIHRPLNRKQRESQVKSMGVPQRCREDCGRPGRGYAQNEGVTMQHKLRKVGERGCGVNVCEQQAGQGKRWKDACMHAWVHVSKPREGAGGRILVYKCREVQGRRGWWGWVSNRGRRVWCMRVSEWAKKDWRRWICPSLPASPLT